VAQLKLKFPKRPIDYSIMQSSNVKRGGWVTAKAAGKTALNKYLAARGIVLGPNVDLSKRK
jgi:hypothetical protein